MPVKRPESANSKPVGLSWAALGLATAGLVLSDIGSTLAGSSTFPGGPLDEIAHLLTTLLLIWAVGGFKRGPMVAALVASVAIEVDHIPGRLGADWLTSGTPRPYTHSLLTIVITLAVAVAWRRRRAIVLGVAFGLAAHLFRDLAQGEGGVSLLWPVSDEAVNFPHWIYAAIMALTVGVDAWRCRALHARAWVRLSPAARGRSRPGQSVDSEQGSGQNTPRTSANGGPTPRETT